ncbi:hypothetical protein SAMN05428981_1011246 [Bacillus sp. OV194]|nr:hypothetical protein SAMN05428981_1011246 [Bacillus sp. OV194]
MLQDLGQRIRLIRNKKRFTVEAFAKQLGVSKGHPVLEKIQKEFLFLSLVPPDQDEDETSFRFNRVIQQFHELATTEPRTTDWNTF